MSTPVVGGFAGGEGASTLAAALHAHDAGACGGDPVDVLVCRPAALARAAAAPGAPVLVVVGDPAGQAERPPDAGPGRTVVRLPYVARWRDPVRPFVEARALLGLSPDRRPDDLHDYARALLAVIAAVVGSGTLLRPVTVTTVLPARRCPAPPAVPGGSAPVLLRAAPPPPRPVRRAAPAVVRPVAGTPLRPGTAPVRPAAPQVRPFRPVGSAHRTDPAVRMHDPDDDALEAGPHLRPAHTRAG